MDIAKVGGYHSISSINVKTEPLNPQHAGSAYSENIVKDSVEISAEGRVKAQESNNLYLDLERMRMQLENSNKQIEAEAEASKVRLKCQEIAMRIRKGDIVPREDHAYLIKNDPDLYMQASSMRVQNDSPKRHKRLSDDDEPRETSVNISGVKISQAQQASETISNDSTITAESGTLPE